MLMTQQEFQKVVEQINTAFQEQFNRLDAFEKRLEALELKPKTASRAKAPAKDAS